MINSAEEAMEIILTRGKVALIDPIDEHLSVYNWYASEARPGKFYAVRQFKKGNGKFSTTYLHHSIMGFPLKGKQIDHINGDTLDNRRENLRIVSVRENASNKEANRNGKIIGVHKQKNRWRAIIWKGGKNHFIGSFLSSSEALTNYRKAIGENQ